MRVQGVKRSGVTFEDIQRIVSEVSETLYQGNVRIDDYYRWGDGTYSFKLRAKESGAPGRLGHYDLTEQRWIDDGPNRFGNRNGDSAPGARSSWSGRRSVAACWHAHRDVYRAILTEFPTLVFVTAMARYEGLAGFEETYPETAYKNIGSMMQPEYMPNLCDC